jgi:hypothetical protein
MSSGELQRNIKTTFLPSWLETDLMFTLVQIYVFLLFNLSIIQLLHIMFSRLHILQLMVFMKMELMRSVTSSTKMEAKCTWMVQI